MTLVMPLDPASLGDPLRACVEPMLRALYWRGSARQLHDALPDIESGRLDLLDLRNAMASLDFASRCARGRLDQMDARLLPCLFVPDEGAPLVVLDLGEQPATLLCYDGETASLTVVPMAPRCGTSCVFTLAEPVPPRRPGQGWFRTMLNRFEPAFLKLMALSLVLNVLALAPALFVQGVYDKVLATHARPTLLALAAGIGIALALDTALRILRGAALAHVGARLDYLIGTASVHKLLALPLAWVERTPIGQQVARLREFDGLRAIFVGPLATVFLDLPYAVVFVAAIAWLGGWLALVPVVMAGVLILAGLIGVRYARRWAEKAPMTLGDPQSLLVEILQNMRAIKAGGTEAIWLERYRERSAQMALVQLRRARVAAMAEHMAHGVNLVAGAATLAIGAGMALDGTITVGALIAAMALVWRVLAPMQTLFVTLTRLDEVGQAVAGIDRMMAMPSEGEVETQRATAHGRRFAGQIGFSRVVLRYQATQEPALAGVSLEVARGSVIAITGGNGSGKSTLLKLVANLYQPQMGQVLIDGVDVRQLDPLDLRQAIAYLPQQSDLFAGTIAENLRLAAPAADMEALQRAVAKAGLLAEIEALPLGFSTRIDTSTPVGFARRLALARTLLCQASIVLLDEPAVATDAAGEDLLLRQIDALRGRATVLLVTHHAPYVRAADRVIVLRQGLVVHDSTPQDLLARIAGAAS